MPDVDASISFLLSLYIGCLAHTWNPDRRWERVLSTCRSLWSFKRSLNISSAHSSEVFAQMASGRKLTGDRNFRLSLPTGGLQSQQMPVERIRQSNRAMCRTEQISGHSVIDVTRRWVRHALREVHTKMKVSTMAGGLACACKIGIWAINYQSGIGLGKKSILGRRNIWLPE